MSSKLNEYEAALQESREQFRTDPVVFPLFAPDVDDRLFARWMLRWSAHGIHMTHDVERWIAGAGEACGNLGMDKLAKALKAHSRAEAGHDTMMVDDVIAISDWWLRTYGEPVDGEGLLAAPALASAGFYARLHEQVITGPTPFAQLAIEYEIERLSVTIGPDLMTTCERVFGANTSCYSFLAEHVELDAGHTAFNQRQLGGILDERPEELTTMVETGRAALASYAAFMAECAQLAKGDLEPEPVPA
ncbi:iron-containing redox enzyme family protein [Herbidospora yilanensis]|uniref:iron-containing redox enzyme family protein n=1 Tax=Herbidospora yilanensis TaxID=354426 RepID=UPI000782B609|nr:iron-containing redox enzyme family protein [Herbidospora yilanensis]